VVAVIQHLEGGFVAAPELGHEALVPKRSQEFPRPRESESAIRSGERVSFHTRIIGPNTRFGNLFAS